jgi:hypothetical protein
VTIVSLLLGRWTAHETVVSCAKAWTVIVLIGNTDAAYVNSGCFVMVCVRELGAYVLLIVLDWLGYKAVPSENVSIRT